jgi:tight adherence protein B
MTLLVVGIGAAAVTCAACLYWLRRGAQESRLLHRFRMYAEEAPALQELPEPLPPPPSRGLAAQVHRALRRAGLSLRDSDFMLLCLTASLGAGFVASESGLPPWAILLTAAAVGYGPLVLIRACGDLRVRKLERQMADAMDLMIAGFQSGSGVRECLDLIRSQKRKPISQEFHELLSLIEVGVPAAEAFKQWARPVDSKIVTVFALGMAAKWEIGGNYSVMLGNLSGRVRELIRLQRRVRTLTAEAKFTGVLGMTLPYGIAAVQMILNPNYLDSLWESPLGPQALAFAIVLQVLAVLWIRRMIRSIFKGS